MELLGFNLLWVHEITKQDLGQLKLNESARIIRKVQGKHLEQRNKSPGHHRPGEVA